VSPDAVFWLAVGGLIVTCAAAIGARSAAEFSRHELEEICRRRNAQERLGQILRRHAQVVLAAETLQVIATAVLIGSGALWVWLERHKEGPIGWPALVFIVATGALLLLAVEIWIPWAVAKLWAERILYSTWPFWRVLGTVLTPLVLGAGFVDTVFHRIAGRTPEVPDEESFEDEIRSIVTEGHREGLLEEDAREMIEGVIELSDVQVSEVMTPRTDMVSVPASMKWPEVLQMVTQVGHTRIPVYQKNRDDIVGILYTKDLLPVLVQQQEEPSPSWTSLLREPYFVPETKPVDVLLQEFQRTHNHMAVVLDEYGGVSGLVTMEDVLEEIVGEIVDEYDKDLVDGIKKLDESTAEVLAKVHVDEINERLELELPDDGDFDTIGGFVFSELGHVPVEGEDMKWKNVHITVLEATARRIERVRIEILDRSQGLQV
jgi:CBS domain containing-hemolysin-like protein